MSTFAFAGCCTSTTGRVVHGRALPVGAPIGRAPVGKGRERAIERGRVTGGPRLPRASAGSLWICRRTRVVRSSGVGVELVLGVAGVFELEGAVLDVEVVGQALPQGIQDPPTSAVGEGLVADHDVD